MSRMPMYVGAPLYQAAAVYPPPPQIQQQMGEISAVLINDQQRIAAVEAQMEAITKKIGDLTAEDQLLGCRVHSLGETIKAVSKLQEETKANQTYRENTANELAELQKRNNTQGAWIRTLEIELQKAKDDLLLRTEERDRMSEVVNTKNKSLYRETRDNGAMRKELKELRLKLADLMAKQTPAAAKVKSTTTTGGFGQVNSNSSGYGTPGFGRGKPGTNFAPTDGWKPKFGFASKEAGPSL